MWYSKKEYLSLFLNIIKIPSHCKKRKNIIFLLFFLSSKRRIKKKALYTGENSLQKDYPLVKVSNVLHFLLDLPIMFHIDQSKDVLPNKNRLASQFNKKKWIAATRSDGRRSESVRNKNKKQEEEEISWDVASRRRTQLASQPITIK